MANGNPFFINPGSGYAESDVSKISSGLGVIAEYTEKERPDAVAKDYTQSVSEKDPVVNYDILDRPYGYKYFSGAKQRDVIRTGNDLFDIGLRSAMDTNDMNIVANYLRSADRDLANKVQSRVLEEMQDRVEGRPLYQQIAEGEDYYTGFDYFGRKMPSKIIKTGNDDFDRGLKAAMDTNDMNAVANYLRSSDRGLANQVQPYVLEEMQNRSGYSKSDVIEERVGAARESGAFGLLGELGKI